MTYDRKVRELLRLKAEGITPEKIIIRSRHLIAVVTDEIIQRIIDEYCDNERKISGLFLSIERGTYYRKYNDELKKCEILQCGNGYMYTAVDGFAECTVECFYHESTAIEYLTRDTDYITLHIRDAQRWSRANNG